MIKISPSILSADLFEIESKVKALDKAGAEYIHIDVMDGHFVKNLTFGSNMVKSLRKITSKVLDVHLMIQPVKLYIQEFVDAGSDIITFHPEADKQSFEIIQMINEGNIKAGIAIHPNTKISEVLSFLPKVQQVIVMTVMPGFGGQKFMENQVYKIKELYDLRSKNNYNYKISVDGGINNLTALKCIENGVDILAVGSYLLDKEEKLYPELIKNLR